MKPVAVGSIHAPGTTACGRRRFALGLTGSAVLLMVATPIVARAQADNGARQAATDWLQQLDAGRYADTWRNAATMFKDAVPQATWEKAIQSAREPLGAVTKRTETSAKAATSLPGVPDGEYMVLTYDASFDHKQRAVETVATVLQADGTWKVAGYFVK